MITRIGFAPAHPALSIPQLHAHWSSRHAELTLQLPHVTRYWQNQPFLENGSYLLPWPGFDVCSEFDFDDGALMDRAFSSQAYFDLVKPDEDYLLDKARGGMLLAQRICLEGEPVPEGIRLLTFFRLAPLRAAEALGKALGSLAKATSAHAREVYVALDGRAAGQRVSMFDAVDINWFDSADAAVEFVLSKEQRDRRYAISDLVRGTENLIARVRMVR